MDQDRFDRFAKALGRTVSRRTGLALAGALGLAAAPPADAGRKKCKPRCAACSACKNGRCKPKPNGTECGGGNVCVGGSCTPRCLPDCAGKACGPDLCGGSCGTCAGGPCLGNQQCGNGSLAVGAPCDPNLPRACSSGFCGCAGQTCTCRYATCAAEGAQCGMPRVNEECCAGTCENAINVGTRCRKTNCVAAGQPCQSIADCCADNCGANGLCGR